jgi:hypothetical protein
MESKTDRADKATELRYFKAATAANKAFLY